MPKTHPLEIEQLHGDDEAFLMSRGHHDPKAFRAQAVIDWGLRTGPSEAGDDIETPTHGYMRIVPRDGYSNWHEPAKGPGPGAFPVTTATCYRAHAAAPTGGEMETMHDGHRAILAAADLKALSESGIQYEFPIGSRVKVTHCGGMFFGAVEQWEDGGLRVRVIRESDGKSLKWWKGQVELAQHKPPAT
jgi:hypothetical protein